MDAISNSSKVLQLREFRLKDDDFRISRELVDCIGRGGYGIVYKATLKSQSSGFVAAKILSKNVDLKVSYLMFFHEKEH
jgi:hypothetical protein